MIERDALVRLNAPRYLGNSPIISSSTPVPPVPGSSRHRRGLSASSSSEIPIVNTTATPRKNKSGTSLSSYNPSQPSSRRASNNNGPGPLDRMSINTMLSDSSSSISGITVTGLSGSTSGTSTIGGMLGGHSTNSPTLSASSSSLAGRRPSRSADPPEVVPERSEEGHDAIDDNDTGGGGDEEAIIIVKSRPPSPVKEASGEEDNDGNSPSKSEKTPTVKTDSQFKDENQYDSSSSQVGQKSYEDKRNSDATVKKIERTSNESTRDIPQREKRRSNESDNGAGATYGEQRYIPQPRSRRASKAPSERSTKSTKGNVYPGIIRLYSTFNDAASLCESSISVPSFPEGSSR